MTGKSRNINKYIQKDGYCEIHITNKLSNRYTITLISNEDVEKVKLGNWGACYDKTIDGFYIRGQLNKKTVQLHRYIIDCPKELQVDHINHNTLDNRRENLRACTNNENQLNKTNSVYFDAFNNTNGISYNKESNKYILAIGRYIGSYKTKEDAMQAKKDFLNGKIKLKPVQVYKKRVRCLETNIVYNSINEAEKECGIWANNIGRCCKGKVKSAGGFHWEFVDNIN